MAQRYHPDIIVTELCLPDGYGLNMMDDILSFQPQCRFMLYTTQIYDEALIDTMILGGFRYLIKDPRLDNMNNVLHAVDLLAQLIIKNMKREEQDQQIRSQLKQLSQTAKRFCCNLLITGGVPEDADQAKSLLKQFGLPMSAPAYSLSVYLFAPDDNPAFDDREGLMYRFLELIFRRRFESPSLWRGLPCCTAGHLWHSPSCRLKKRNIVFSGPASIIQ